MSAGKCIHYRRKVCGRKRFRTPNPQFTTRRVGEKSDIHYALFELIKRGIAALEQSTTIHRWFDASPSPIEEAHVQRVLQVGDHLRNGRLRNSELLSRLRHAAKLCDRKKYMQILQPKPAPNPAFPVDDPRHMPGPRHNRLFMET